MSTKVFIYTNCQNVGFHMNVSSTYQFVRDDIDKELFNCSYDYILTQPVFSMRYTTMDILRKYDPRKVIIYPSYYLGSYHTNLTYIMNNGKLLTNPMDYHYKDIIRGYRDGLSGDEIYQNILDFDVSDEYINEITLANLTHTRDNLSQFNNLCPNIIHNEEFILANYRTHRLGHSMNHPTLFYNSWLVKQIKTYFPFEIVKENIDMLGHIVMPIYPKILNHFQFIFDNNFEYNGIKCDLKGMIKYYIDAYDKLSTDDKEILLSVKF